MGNETKWCCGVLRSLLSRIKRVKQGTEIFLRRPGQRHKRFTTDF